MKCLIFVQAGDYQQCARNLIPGWEYAFGMQDYRAMKYYESHCYTFRSYKKAAGVKITRGWSARPQFRNNFKLTLVYEE